MSEFRWKDKKLEDLTIEELRGAVNFFLEGHDQYLTYAKSEDMKRLEIENKLLKDILKNKN